MQSATEVIEGAPGSPVSSSTLPLDFRQTIGYNLFVWTKCTCELQITF